MGIFFTFTPRPSRLRYDQKGFFLERIFFFFGEKWFSWCAMIKQRFFAGILFLGIGFFLIMAVACTRTMCPAYAQRDIQPLIQEHEVAERPT